MLTLEEHIRTLRNHNHYSRRDIRLPCSTHDTGKRTHRRQRHEDWHSAARPWSDSMFECPSGWYRVDTRRTMVGSAHAGLPFSGAYRRPHAHNMERRLAYDRTGRKPRKGSTYMAQAVGMPRHQATRTLHTERRLQRHATWTDMAMEP